MKKSSFLLSVLSMALAYSISNLSAADRDEDFIRVFIKTPNGPVKEKVEEIDEIYTSKETLYTTFKRPKILLFQGTARFEESVESIIEKHITHPFSIRFLHNLVDVDEGTLWPVDPDASSFKMLQKISEELGSDEKQDPLGILVSRLKDPISDRGVFKWDESVVYEFCVSSLVVEYHNKNKITKKMIPLGEKKKSKFPGRKDRSSVTYGKHKK